MTDAAALDLATADGTSIGTVTISCLPDNLQWRDMSTLLDQRDVPTQPSASAPVQLLEEVEYRFELCCAEPIARIEPAELFSPSGASNRDGRLKAGRSTGSVRLEVTLASGAIGTCEVEVRSRKLNYESEYRFMLTRIATESAELAQSTFAPSALRGLEPSSEANAETLYQRFAFLQALVDSGELDRAFQIIRHRPHLEYRTETNRVDPARALRPSADLARQLVGPGPRQRVAHPIAGLSTAPLAIDERCHVETFDTVPNRFVRFAVHHWRNLADDVADRLGQTAAADQRGRREARRMSESLSRLLARPALAEAGELTSFPQANTTLHGRSGYREIFRSFLLGEAATTITWDDGPDLFRAGQHRRGDPVRVLGVPGTGPHRWIPAGLQHRPGSTHSTDDDWPLTGPDSRWEGAERLWPPTRYAKFDLSSASTGPSGAMPVARAAGLWRCGPTAPCASLSPGLVRVRHVAAL